MQFKGWFEEHQDDTIILDDFIQMRAQMGEPG